MSIFSRAEQLFKGTELLSEIPADLDAVSVAQRINELTIQRLSDGGYMFRVANADNSPCAVVSRDGSSIQLYADAARKNDDFLRFLLRTAFECRFCHEGIVSLHAACVELGTAGRAAHPFLYPAFAARRTDMTEQIARAVIRRAESGGEG